MKRHFILCLALVAMVGEVGCKSTPNQAGYKTAGVTLTTVDAAMQAWGQYVRSERARIAATPVLERGSQSEDLTRLEGRVRNAFGKYQTALYAADLAVVSSGGFSAAPEVASAAAELIAVIQANIKH